MADKNENVQRSLHNLPKTHSILANYLNIRDLLQYDKVIMSLDALEIVKNIWGQGEHIMAEIHPYEVLRRPVNYGKISRVI